MDICPLNTRYNITSMLKGFQEGGFHNWVRRQSLGQLCARSLLYRAKSWAITSKQTQAGPVIINALPKKTFYNNFHTKFLNFQVNFIQTFVYAYCYYLFNVCTNEVLLNLATFEVIQRPSQKLSQHSGVPERIFLNLIFNSHQI